MHEVAILYLLIPSPSAPRNNIDVYLQPLIAELKELWGIGTKTYDCSKKKNFQMRATLMWMSFLVMLHYLDGVPKVNASPICNKHTFNVVKALW